MKRWKHKLHEYETNIQNQHESFQSKSAKLQTEAEETKQAIRNQTADVSARVEVLVAFKYDCVG